MIEAVADGLRFVMANLHGEFEASARSSETVSSARRALADLVGGHSPKEVARRLAERGISVWHGDNYAYELMDRFGLCASGGAVRASMVLYNDEADVGRLVEAVAEISWQNRA